jgi:hypothetical protein
MESDQILTPSGTARAISPVLFPAHPLFTVVQIPGESEQSLGINVLKRDRPAPLVVENKVVAFPLVMFEP